jgi:hypothetical protein
MGGLLFGIFAPVISLLLPPIMGQSFKLLLSYLDQNGQNKKGYFALSFGGLGISLSLPSATSAAFLPERSIEPKVGPILGRPCVSVTDIPVAINPGNTSSV